MTGTLLSLLPTKGTVYVYGVLSGKPVSNIQGIDLIYYQKQVKGFLLSQSWLTRGGPLATFFRMRRAIRTVASGLNHGGWTSTDFVDCSLSDMKEKFDQLHASGVTGKKLRVRMNLEESSATS